MSGPLDRLRGLCLALPETTERLSHGEPAWFVRGKKTFVSFADHHHADPRTAFWCAAPAGAQTGLVAAYPHCLYLPPYVGGRGWVGVSLEPPTDWELVADLVEQAYRVIAPATLVAQLDGVSDESPTAR